MPAKKPSEKLPDIVLTVTDFKDVLTTRARERGTVHRIHVEPNNHPNVFMKKTSTRVQEQTGESKVLNIVERGTKLVFRIEAEERDGTKHTYYPIGIAFQQRGGRPDGDGMGRDDFLFDTVKLRGRRLEIVDVFSDKCGCNESYKFSVIIQREADGKIGIIDPGIEHQPN